MYRLVTLMFEWPARPLMSASGIPAATHQEIAECRQSWTRRPGIPAFSIAGSQ
jgi:hypothetical protein